MNAAALTNRHPVDELAEVRAKIKFLGERESELKETISKMMGGADSLGGDEFIARQMLSERKGSLDEKAMKAAGIDTDKFRKPATVVMSLRIERREMEAAI
jgi:uncharacterized protein (UPF0335 family)